MCHMINHSLSKIFLMYTAAPTITSFLHGRSATRFILSCTSTNSPATDVSWTRDGYTLRIDGEKQQFYQTVTSRRSSTYQNTLVVDDDIENIIGNYTCSIRNRFGNVKSKLTVRGKVAIAYSYVSVQTTISPIASVFLINPLDSSPKQAPARSNL